MTTTNLKIKLPFGLKNNDLVHISEVKKGLECNCVCSACNHPLIARKGDKNQHHFAHYRTKECEHALESALHLAAKKILESEKRIRLPRVTIEKWDYEVSEEKVISFDEVRLETRLDSIIPDVIVYAKGRPLIIEIAVTHFTEKAKLQKIRSMNISTLEISLNQISKNIPYEELKDVIIQSTDTKKWIYNVRKENIINEIHELSEKKKVVQRGFALHVDNCPMHAREWHGKSYANLSSDCFNCEYLFDTISPINEYEYDYSPIEILCLGNSKEHAFIHKLLKRI